MKEMKEITCFLAGPFKAYDEYPDWRDKVRAEVKITNYKIKFRDPRFDTKQGSISTFVSGDLKHARESHVCLLYDNAEDVVGGSIEAKEADSHNRLVIFCSEFNTTHPMILGIARRVYIGLDSAIRYLTLLSEYGLENELTAAYQMLRERWLVQRR